ncbi:MAG: hypothetical protein WDO73_04025 [Ignavibacteriota bacterium]
MSTVSTSLNPGVADLLQTLTKINSPVMNSPAVVAALKDAPAADIVHLSEQATQLQNVQAMFGSDASPDAGSLASLFGVSSKPVANPILQALEKSGATLSPTEQASNAQAASQAILVQGLFGREPEATTAGNLFSTLG